MTRWAATQVHLLTWVPARSARSRRPFVLAPPPPSPCTLCTHAVFHAGVAMSCRRQGEARTDLHTLAGATRLEAIRCVLGLSEHAAPGGLRAGSHAFACSPLVLAQGGVWCPSRKARAAAVSRVRRGRGRGRRRGRAELQSRGQRHLCAWFAPVPRQLSRTSPIERTVACYAGVCVRRRLCGQADAAGAVHQRSLGCVPVLGHCCPRCSRSSTPAYGSAPCARLPQWNARRSSAL